MRKHCLTKTEYPDCEFLIIGWWELKRGVHACRAWDTPSTSNFRLARWKQCCSLVAQQPGCSTFLACTLDNGAGGISYTHGVFFYVILCHVHNNLYNYVFVLLTIKPHPPKKMNNFSVMKLKKKHRSWDSTSCPTNKINEEPVRRPSWWRHLLLSMLSWVQFLEPTRWKKRRDSLKLSSHLYIHAGAYIIHMHK